MTLSKKLLTLAKQALLLVLACHAHAQAVDVTASVRVVDTPPGAKHPSPANVVVWLTPIDAPLPPAPKPHPRLTQKNKEFSPHLLVVPTGTSVDFPNMDPFFHNVFSLFNGKRFDLGLYEAGSHRSVSFDREGVSYIFCNIHPEMGAIVIALGTPYYAISAADGSITIHGVQPGRYRLQTWAEQLRPAPSQKSDPVVEVTSKEASLGALDFISSADNILAHHKNKFGKDYSSPTSQQY